MIYILIYFVIGFLIGVFVVRRNSRIDAVFQPRRLEPEIGIAFLLAWPVLVPLTILYKIFEWLGEL